MDLTENSMLTAMVRKKLSSAGFLNWKQAREFAQRVIDEFDVRTPGPQSVARSLSGGNLQKFVIGREVLQDPNVLIVNQPTWGVDAAAAAAIRQSLLDLASKGAAVIVISQDLDELMEISTRFAALNTGKLSKIWGYLAPILAVIATMIGGGMMFALLGKDPFEAIRIIFYDPLFSEFAWYYRPQLLIKGAPLILIAIGLSMGFRAGVWNIGAEGQYIIGALFGAGFALAVYPTESVFIFPSMIILGALGGFLWAMIPAILKTKFGTNEILVSLMLVYVAEQLLASMSLGLMKNPEGFGFPGSRNLQQYASAHNAELWIGSGVHMGVVFGLIAVIFAYVMLARHQLGFHIRLTGESPKAARFAGVNPNRLIIFCLGSSGALAGLAGLFEIAGPSGQVNIDFNVGYGFTAIIVAFLGRLNPFGIMLAGLLMALTYIGGEIAQSSLGLPSAAIQAFQGMLLFFLLAVDLLTNFKIKWAKTEIIV
jgi:ABC-type uncharacterized transport system permease subunit